MQFSKKIFGDSDKKAYFCSNKSHHASQRCVPRWDFAFYKGYMDYDKQPINVDEQVALLQNRGLVIEERACVIGKLENECVKAFLDHEEEILAGTFEGPSSTTSRSTSAVHPSPALRFRDRRFMPASPFSTSSFRVTRSWLR